MQRGVEAARGLVFSKRTYNAACLERLLGISLSLPYIICQSMEIRVSMAEELFESCLQEVLKVISSKRVSFTFRVCGTKSITCEQALRGALAAGREKEGELATTSLEFEFRLQFPRGSPSTELSDVRQFSVKRKRALM